MHPPLNRVEDEAKMHFLYNIFSPEPYDFDTVIEVLESMKTFQKSTEKRERKVLRCVIDELFEKRKYFPTYSLCQLMKVEHLFGGMIECDLISNKKDLNEAYDFILDALKKSPESEMFYFGLMALDRIKHLLINRPEYCTEISNVPYLNDFPPELIKLVNSGKIEQKTKNVQKPILPVPKIMPEIQKPNRNITTDTTVPDPVTSVSSKKPTTDVVSSSKNSIVSSARVEKTRSAATDQQNNDNKEIEPPESVQQKIALIFNSMNQENVRQKCAEVKENLKRRHLPWFSAFVTKRIRDELNSHSLYSTCLDCFDSSPLNRLIESETVINIKALFAQDTKSPRTKASLENLGHWLGLITLAKDKPVPFDLHRMVIDAYYKEGDELAFALPFVTKILESCRKSKVYNLESSWNLKIMDCLAELHRTPRLKFTTSEIQREIEHLFKTLGVKLQYYPGYTLLNPVGSDFYLSGKKNPNKNDDAACRNSTKTNDFTKFDPRCQTRQFVKSK